MLKYLIPTGCIFLLMACGQQAAEKATASSDTATVNKAVAADPVPQTPVNTAKAGNFDKIEIAGIPKAILDSIPPNYSILDTASGNLNLDAYTDLLVVLKKNGEDTSSDITDHPEKRPLLIFTGQPDKTFKWAASNDKVVYCVDGGGMMGDPFMGLVIKNGYFSVEHYGGSRQRWQETITFKYMPADSAWYLHKHGLESFEVVEEGENDHRETKILTTKNFGKVPFGQFDVYKGIE